MEQEPVLCFFVTISQMCDKECHSIQNNGQRRFLVTAVFLVPLP